MPDDVVVATGTASLVVVDAETHRPTAVSEAIWEPADKLDGAAPRASNDPASMGVNKR